MKWLDAAEAVLREYGHALHYMELAWEIGNRGQVDTKSRTPEITLHTSISQDIRRRQSAGLAPRFVRYAGGDFGLAEWDVEAIETVRTAISEHRDHARRRLRRGLRELGGEDFVSFLEVLLTTLGYEVTVTEGADDDGIDLIAERSGDVAAERVGIQAKQRARASRRIGPNTVRLLRDALPTQQCTSGAVITTTDFDDRAVAVSQEPGNIAVKLIRGDELVDMAMEAGVGVRREELTLVVENLYSVFEVEEDSLMSS